MPQVPAVALARDNTTQITLLIALRGTWYDRQQANRMK